MNTESISSALPASEKYMLTIKEAAEYFNIGTKKMRRITEDKLGDVAVYCGNRYLIVRYLGEGSVVIFHKHKFSHPYHQHGRANTLRQAVRGIKSHDMWQMGGRKNR